MNIYMFHYVNEHTFNYFHFDIDELDMFIKKCKEKKYEFISFSEFSKSRKCDLNKKILLTFDDGTLDHYKFVYKILKKNNVPGLFFICSNIISKKILDVNLIHALISKCDFDELYSSFEQLLKKYKYVYNNNNLKTNYDSKKMAFFKQSLQYILPFDIKEKILNELCESYKISLDYDNYYINEKMIFEMKKNGMEFGFHTVNHVRLEFLNYENQKREIMDCYEGLKEKGIIEKNAPFAYPFGSYNENTLKILRENNINFAFTVNQKEYDNENSLLIPRIDCRNIKIVEI